MSEEERERHGYSNKLDFWRTSEIPRRVTRPYRPGTPSTWKVEFQRHKFEKQEKNGNELRAGDRAPGKHRTQGHVKLTIGQNSGDDVSNEKVIPDESEAQDNVQHLKVEESSPIVTGYESNSHIIQSENGATIKKLLSQDETTGNRTIPNDHAKDYFDTAVDSIAENYKSGPKDEFNRDMVDEIVEYSENELEDERNLDLEPVVIVNHDAHTGDNMDELHQEALPKEDNSPSVSNSTEQNAIFEEKMNKHVEFNPTVETIGHSDYRHPPIGNVRCCEFEREGRYLKRRRDEIQSHEGNFEGPNTERADEQGREYLHVVPMKVETVPYSVWKPPVEDKVRCPELTKLEADYSGEGKPNAKESLANDAVYESDPRKFKFSVWKPSKNADDRSEPDSTSKVPVRHETVEMCSFGKIDFRNPRTCYSDSASANSQPDDFEYGQNSCYSEDYNFELASSESDISDYIDDLLDKCSLYLKSEAKWNMDGFDNLSQVSHDSSIFVENSSPMYRETSEIISIKISSATSNEDDVSENQIDSVCNSNNGDCHEPGEISSSLSISKLEVPEKTVRCAPTPTAFGKCWDDASTEADNESVYNSDTSPKINHHLLYTKKHLLSDSTIADSVCSSKDDGGIVKDSIRRFSRRFSNIAYENERNGQSDLCDGISRDLRLCELNPVLHSSSDNDKTHAQERTKSLIQNIVTSSPKSVAINDACRDTGLVYTGEEAKILAAEGAMGEGNPDIDAVLLSMEHQAAYGVSAKHVDGGVDILEVGDSSIEMVDEQLVGDVAEHVEVMNCSTTSVHCGDDVLESRIAADGFETNIEHITQEPESCIITEFTEMSQTLDTTGEQMYTEPGTRSEITTETDENRKSDNSGNENSVSDIVTMATQSIQTTRPRHRALRSSPEFKKMRSMFDSSEYHKVFSMRDKEPHHEIAIESCINTGDRRENEFNIVFEPSRSQDDCHHHLADKGIDITAHASTYGDVLDVSCSLDSAKDVLEVELSETLRRDRETDSCCTTDSDDAPSLDSSAGVLDVAHPRESLPGHETDSSYSVVEDSNSIIEQLEALCEALKMACEKTCSNIDSHSLPYRDYQAAEHNNDSHRQLDGTNYTKFIFAACNQFCKLLNQLQESTSTTDELTRGSSNHLVNRNGSSHIKCPKRSWFGAKFLTFLCKISRLFLVRNQSKTNLTNNNADLRLMQSISSLDSNDEPQSDIFYSTRTVTVEFICAWLFFSYVLVGIYFYYIINSLQVRAGGLI